MELKSMRYKEFEIEVVKESGKIDVGKIRGDGRLLITLGKMSVDLDLDGMVAEFFATIHGLESGARSGLQISGYPNEVSNSLMSDDGKSIAIVKLKAPKVFWERRKKRLSNGEVSLVYRGAIQVNAQVKGAHFWVSSHDISDIFSPETPNFETLVFPKIQEAFDKFCRMIDGFFHEGAQLPESHSVSEVVKDSYGTEITYDLKLTCVIPDRAQGVLEAYQKWRRYSLEEPTQKPSIPEPAHDDSPFQKA